MSDMPTDAEMAVAGVGEMESNPPVPPAPRMHDAPMHDEEVDVAHARKIADRMRDMVQVNIHGLKKEVRTKLLHYAAAFAATPRVDVIQACKFLNGYAKAPHKDCKELISNLEFELAHYEMEDRKAVLRAKIAEFKELQVRDDKPTDEQKETLRKMHEKVENTELKHVDANVALVLLVHSLDGYTPAPGDVTTLGTERLSKHSEGMEQLVKLYKKHGAVMPGHYERQAMCVGDRNEWITFYNEEEKRQREEIIAKKRHALPEIDEKICAKWLDGKYTRTPAGRAGPEVWRVMITAYNKGIFEEFSTINPKTGKRKYWIEHIVLSAGTVSSADRGDVYNPVANNAYNFGVLPDWLNRSDLMQSDADSAIKEAFWGNNIVMRARQEGQRQYKKVQAAANDRLLAAIANNQSAHEEVVFKHSWGALETTRQASLIEGASRLRLAKGVAKADKNVRHIEGQRTVESAFATSASSRGAGKRTKHPDIRAAFSSADAAGPSSPAPHPPPDALPVSPAPKRARPSTPLVAPEVRPPPPPPLPPPPPSPPLRPSLSTEDPDDDEVYAEPPRSPEPQSPQSPQSRAVAQANALVRQLNDRNWFTLEDSQMFDSTRYPHTGRSSADRDMVVELRTLRCAYKHQQGRVFKHVMLEAVANRVTRYHLRRLLNISPESEKKLCKEWTERAEALREARANYFDAYKRRRARLPDACSAPSGRWASGSEGAYERLPTRIRHWFKMARAVAFMVGGARILESRAATKTLGIPGKMVKAILEQWKLVEAILLQTAVALLKGPESDWEFKTEVVQAERGYDPEHLHVSCKQWWFDRSDLPLETLHQTSGTFGEHDRITVDCNPKDAARSLSYAAALTEFDLKEMMALNGCDDVFPEACVGRLQRFRSLLGKFG